jgi:hypothetical protein
MILWEQHEHALLWDISDAYARQLNAGIKYFHCHVLASIELLYKGNQEKSRHWGS